MTRIPPNILIFLKRGLKFPDFLEALVNSRYIVVKTVILEKPTFFWLDAGVFFELWSTWQN